MTTESGWMSLDPMHSIRVQKQGHAGERLYATGICGVCLHGPCRCDEITRDRPVRECSRSNPDCDIDTTSCDGCASGMARCTCGQRLICRTHDMDYGQQRL